MTEFRRHYQKRCSKIIFSYICKNSHFREKTEVIREIRQRELINNTHSEIF